jgi:hypothetical protein
MRVRGAVPSQLTDSLTVDRIGGSGSLGENTVTHVTDITPLVCDRYRHDRG